MDYTVTPETFASLSAYWTDTRQRLKWGSVFILPMWLKAWWENFGGGARLHLCAVRQQENILGIAPLKLDSGGTASFVGSPDVCDYLDFVITPGMEDAFFKILLNDLKAKHVVRLDLSSLRPDSTVITTLIPMAHKLGLRVSQQSEEVSLELDLPAAWEEYLELLSAKQRHELRRKLRRLREAGEIEFICHEAGSPALMADFFRLFTLSREDKARFMTPKMESFFGAVAGALGETGVLRLGTLTLDSLTVAMVMVFDFQNSFYLYNSGYDPTYGSLSVGLISKALSIKSGIQKGRHRFDFLKGPEDYKHHLGGTEIPLYRCQIELR